MTAEQDKATRQLAKLTIKLDRVKLAAERIEQIYLRGNLRKLTYLHSREARALAENVRQIIAELRPPDPGAMAWNDRPERFWNKGESK